MGTLGINQIGTTVTNNYGDKTHYLPVFYNNGEAQIGLPEVTITPRNNLSMEAVVDKGKRTGFKIAAPIVGGSALASMSAVGGLGKALDIAGMIEDPTNPLNYIDKFKIRQKGLKIIHPNRIQRMLNPERAKQLDKMNDARKFMKDSGYEYVSDNVVKQAIENAPSGSLYRAVGPGSTPHKDLLLHPNMSASSELIDNGKFMYENTPFRVTWASTKPKYVKTGRPQEIHIQPESDFSFVKPQNPNRANSRYVNSYDPDSRIVNSDGFNLDSGEHFIQIPRANNSYARMRSGVNYNVNK